MHQKLKRAMEEWVDQGPRKCRMRSTALYPDPCQHGEYLIILSQYIDYSSGDKNKRLALAIRFHTVSQVRKTEMPDQDIPRLRKLFSRLEREFEKKFSRMSP